MADAQVMHGRAHGHDRTLKKRVRGAHLLVLVVALSLARCGLAPASAPAAEPGFAAPPIVGTTLDGKTFDLNTYRGQPVIVNFWASWCVPCRAEFPLFVATLAAHASAGLTIVGVIYQDSPDAAKSFAASHGGSWPNVLDPSGALASAYTVVAPPQTYFIDRTGVLRSRQIGEITQADLDRQLAGDSSVTPLLLDGSNP